MNRKHRPLRLLGFAALLAAIVAAVFLTGKSGGGEESIKEVMRDAVLHEENRMLFPGGLTVNPGLISAYTVTGILLLLAAAARLFVIPRFREIPGKLQTLLEALVGMFDNLAKSNSPHRNRFLGAYVFGAGVYVFFSTVFELFGLQGVTTTGRSISLPAPLSDINGAISMGVVSYLVILSGGIVSNGFRGVGSALKEFSLPISMSFRLFGAMLSGLLVTELVYAYLMLSFVLPVFVAVLFTLLHAIIQTYVLTMLTALFYGEVSEPHEKKRKKVA